MKVILINNSSDAYSYLSGTVVVPAEGSLDVDPSFWFGLYTDQAFLADIRKNNIQIGDGIQTYSMAEGEGYLQAVNSFNFNNRDVDGAMVVRMKAAKKGWSFWALPIEITTATLGGSKFCQDSLGVDIPGITCKIYNAQNQEITEAGIAGANLLTCVKTVLDVEHAFDYELIGGALRINSNPGNDIRMWIVGAPDIPAQFGGSKEFASGINLKFMAPDSSFDIDGRVSKFISYNAATHQGKLRIILKHPAGAQVNFQFVIHMYRQ